MKLVSILFLLLQLISCASKEEIEERQQAAYDLSGSYSAVENSNSETAMDFSIINEGSRNNIYILVENRLNLNKKESSLLQKLKIDEKKVYNHFFAQPLAVGKGLSDIQRREGGDNISTDFGNSTKFSVCSSSLNYTANMSIYYCLKGTTSKASNNISGTMSLNVVTTTVVQQPNNQPPQTTSTTDSVELKFSTTGSFVFYKQNFGLWNQEHVWSENENVKKLIQSIQLTGESTVSTKEVSIRLPYFQSNKYFTNEGVKYVFDENKNRVTLEEFLKHSPAVVHYELRPEDTKINRKIYFTGQIWSLGNFSGELSIEDETGEIGTLGIVRYFKK
jgi:hypothetical protein